jgi:O-antigen ligase
MGIRAVLHATTIELIRERPIFGHGTGSFGTEYGARVGGRYTDWRATPSTDPHSQYLFVTMELGVVGLAAFIAVLIAGFLAARAGHYGWIGGTALAIWCLTSVFNSHFRTFPEGHLIGLFLGAMLAAAPADPGSPARSG